ncbi:acetyltransferase domain-containing protein [Xylaria bambusicola]|uniref:acetyltransferase domain-containing protein n=1 Tax=Xylaria bambusicola TaxID=326684 RepID=UPI0020073776|nr:acetyltransferase domain-containing protein [Xylaria bambusicola]KAI0516698.1 acetyltransferase domain-containing protein [Xylaria bambusicola]
MTSKTPTTIIRTTLPRLPLPPPSTRAPILTPRLLLRPLTPSDAEAYYKLRSDPAFMSESTLGKPDVSPAETLAALAELANPARETFLFGVFIAATHELIGDGGIHTVRFSGMGWPEIGYKLAPAHWGQGYATEAMRGVLEAWWALPREEVEVRVHGETVREGEGAGLARERVAAEIATYNKGSENVLSKLGFEHFGTWEEPDTQLHRLGQPLEMGHYVLSSPS